MGKVERFEDLEIWQGAREIVRLIYKVTTSTELARDYGLRDQLRRAAISTMANVAEGFSRRSRKEFAQFLFTAKASGAEVQSHLYVALDQGYIDDATFQSLYDRVDTWARQTSTLITYLLAKPSTQPTQ